MTATAIGRVRDLGPGELDWSADQRLAPDHPFLRHGTWRAFVAGDPPQDVRVVASVDPRQQSAAGQVGAIGFIASRGASRSSVSRPTIRAAVAAAESWLVAGGCSVARCPVQFSTWYGHRVMTDGFPAQGGVAPFPMEPAAIPGLAEAMDEAGFRVAHVAGSYRIEAERWIEEARLGEALMRASGFRDRAVRVDRLDQELQTIHAISIAAFRRSWGFSDIALDEFLSIYRPLLRLVDPALVRLADSPDGRSVGFAFAYADPAVPGGRPDARFIVKSVAVLPEVRRASPGIGTGLAVAVHRLAAARGYPIAIHACTANDAYTQRVSARSGERFRSYATYEKALR
ncbi:MAG TPA: hypothetical protein VF494_07920 [Candidatus Limnocylindrales bacterium]